MLRPLPSRRFLVATLLLTTAASVPAGESAPPSHPTGATAIPAAAADTPAPSRYADTLTGNWGGWRDSMADHGLTLDLSFTEYYGGLLTGEGNDDWEFGRRVDAFANLDTGKLGLWEGGGLHTHAEARFGDAPGFRGGALWPLTTGMTLPLGGTDRLVASSLYLSQRLGESARLMVGKINAVDLLAADPFFGGWGRDRFQNIAFVAPPSGVVPPTIIGAVLSWKLDPVSLTFMAFDPNDRTNDYWPDDLFADGANFSLGATWAGKVAGRTSSLGVTGTWSTKDGADLGQLLLPPELKTGEKDGAYNVALSLSHLLVESTSRPGQGLGVYLKGATADGNPNPIRASIIGGLAGHGLVPGRPRDSFGLGYFHYNFSDSLEDAASPVADLGDEQGMEAFYNCAVTPWFHLGADLQVVDPGREKRDTLVYAGLRATLHF